MDEVNTKWYVPGTKIYRLTKKKNTVGKPPRSKKIKIGMYLFILRISLVVASCGFIRYPTRTGNFSAVKLSFTC